MITEDDLHQIFQMYDFENAGRVKKKDVIILCEYDLDIIHSEEGRDLIMKMLNNADSSDVSYETFEKIVKRLRFIDQVRKRFLRSIHKASSVPNMSRVHTPNETNPWITGDSVLKNAIMELDNNTCNKCTDIPGVLQKIDKLDPQTMNELWNIILYDS